MSKAKEWYTMSDQTISEMMASHAILCYLDQYQINLPEDRSITESMALLTRFAGYFLTKGVKIGGLYRHWKGDVYRVTDVVRDADKWEQYRVVYYQNNDPFHRADRRLEDFLGKVERAEYTGRRFTLLVE
jgi:hypothetical protein